MLNRHFTKILRILEMKVDEKYNAHLIIEYIKQMETSDFMDKLIVEKNKNDMFRIKNLIRGQRDKVFLLEYILKHNYFSETGFSYEWENFIKKEFIKNIKYSRVFIEKYCDHFTWSELCYHQDIPEDLIEKKLHKMNRRTWKVISLRQKLSHEFISKNRFQLDWDDMITKNRSLLLDNIQEYTESKGEVTRLLRRYPMIKIILGCDDPVDLGSIYNFPVNEEKIVHVMRKYKNKYFFTKD